MNLTIKTDKEGEKVIPYAIEYILPDYKKNHQKKTENGKINGVLWRVTHKEKLKDFQIYIYKTNTSTVILINKSKR